MRHPKLAPYGGFSLNSGSGADYADIFNIADPYQVADPGAFPQVQHTVRPDDQGVHTVDCPAPLVDHSQLAKITAVPIVAKQLADTVILAADSVQHTV